MADTDKKDDDKDQAPDQQQGAGALGLVAAPVAGYAGAIGVAQIFDKDNTKLASSLTEATTAHNTAKAAYDTKYATSVNTLTEETANRALHNEHVAAETVHTLADREYTEAVRKLWGNESASAAPAIQGKIAIATAESQLKLLKEAPASNARNLAIASTESQLNALKTKTAEEAFGKLSAAKANAAINSTIGEAQANFLKANKDAVKAVKSEFEELMNLYQKKPQAILDAMAKAEPEIAKRITEATKVQKETLTAAKTALEETKKKWLPKVEELTKTEKAALAAAEKTVQRLKSIEVLNAEKGIWSAIARPAKLFMPASGYTKLGIAGAATALGGLAYMGVRAFRGKTDQPDTFTGREDMKRNAANGRGAEASPAAG